MRGSEASLLPEEKEIVRSRRREGEVADSSGNMGFDRCIRTTSTEQALRMGTKGYSSAKSAMPAGSGVSQAYRLLQSPAEVTWIAPLVKKGFPRSSGRFFFFFSCTWAQGSLRDTSDV